MADLAALSHAVAEALRDAEAHGAVDAARFLRVDVHELFRLARQRQVARSADDEFAPHDPGTRRHEHG